MVLRGGGKIWKKNNKRLLFIRDMRVANFGSFNKVIFADPKSREYLKSFYFISHPLIENLYQGILLLVLCIQKSIV